MEPVSDWAVCRSSLLNGNMERTKSSEQVSNLDHNLQMAKYKSNILFLNDQNI